MRSLPTLIFLLAISACHPAKPTEYLATQDLKYSAYSWHSGVDSTELYLAHYLYIDKSGHYMLMRHDTFMDNPKYFNGEINDTIRSLIRKAFMDNKYHKDYFFEKDNTVIYDGFTYLFDYTKKDGGQRQAIQFIPSQSPAQIQTLATMLDKLIYLSDKSQVQAFSLTEYKNELIKISLTHALPRKISPRFEIRQK